MTTYNAVPFLKEQLDSIVGQSYSQWRLLISDDGSSDRTRDIIRYYQDGDRIIDATPSHPFHNVSQNVEYLLHLTQADYVMFSDHDDVWKPDKVSRSLDTITGLENGNDQPLLVYTDLEVVDSRLLTLDASLWHYSRLKPTKQLRELVFQNVVTGCTMTANRALVEKATPFPAEIFMYDWWIALVAAEFGTMVPLYDATVRYRQHDSNVIGASSLSQQSASWRPGALAGAVVSLRNVFNRRMDRTTTQALVFLDRYGPELGSYTTHALTEYAALRSHSFLKRRYLAWRYGFFRNSLYTLLGMLLFL